MGAALKLEQLQVAESEHAKSRPYLRLIPRPVLQVNNGITQYSNTTDANGLLLSIADLHNPQTLVHDLRGRLTRRNFASARQITYGYDDFDRLLTITDNAGPSLSLVRDVMGKVLTQTVTPLNGGAAQTTVFTYDARDRLTQISDAKNQVMKINYNIVSVGCHVRDLPTSITDGAGNVERREYDNRQRLTRVTDADNHVTRFEYNSRGDKIAQTDASGNRSTFSFDGNDRLVQQTIPTTTGASSGPASATQVTNFSYDPAGRLTSTDIYALSAQGFAHSTTTMAYDPLDRMIQKTLQQGSTIEDNSTFTYQRQLDTVKIATASNQVEQLSFTNENAPPFALTAYSTQSSDSSNPLNLLQGNFTVTRDTTGNIAGVTGPMGQLFAAGFDPAGRLTGVQSAFSGSNYSVSQGFDGFGRRTSVTHSTGLSGSFGFDPLNRPTSVAWNGFDGQTAKAMSENLAYDFAGNITALTRENGSFALSYNNSNQLVSSAFTANQGTNLGPLVNRNLAYDATGNRTSDNVNGGGAFYANTILSDALHSFQMDANGQGNITQRTTPSAQIIDLFTYRSDAKLTSYMKVNDVNGNGAFDLGTDTVVQSAQYFYDPFGRRVAKKIQVGTDPAFNHSFVYLGDQDKILLGTAGDGSTTLLIDGQGIDEHLAEISPQGVKAYVTDHLGSVLNGAAAADTMAFAAFGERTAQAPLTISASSPAVVYGFAGRQLDLESEIYYNRARMYDRKRSIRTSLSGHFLVAR
ncbi:MAG: RHS repeat protein [Deltaproteobacteria bacterium]|nr:RHS repeat protein [Deltaproteobacteria bacterium]